MRLLDSQDLAAEARRVRKNEGLTQSQVATLLVERRDAESCSRQAISLAENPEVGSRLDGLRIKIIQLITGQKIVGPKWHYEREGQ